MCVISKSSFLFLVFINVLVLVVPSLFALNTDGVLLLSFKYSILSDPLSVLQNWNYDDETPCLWNGVTCSEIGNPGTPDMFRVTSLVLPNSQLLGSVTKDLCFIQHLKHLDLSNNFFNGSLPVSIFNSTELQVLSLSNNVISGQLPELIGEMKTLRVLNLSDNAFAGKLPQNLTDLKNLTVVSLRSNYFSGEIPSGFNSVGVLDLSSNLFNGSLPLHFGGDSLRYLNLSYNKISGSISPEFAKRIPQNATIDLSFNNLTGAIPDSQPMLHQRSSSYSGNLGLCGKPLKNLCSIPSTLSTPPNVSTIPPAIAVIPKNMSSVPVANSQQIPNQPQSQNQNQNQAPQSGLKPGTIVAIAVADLAGIAIIAMVILYVYQLRKRKAEPNETGGGYTNNSANQEKKHPTESITKTEQLVEHNSRKPAPWSSCLTITGGEEESTSEATTSSDSDQDNNNNNNNKHKGGILVTVDNGEIELELETLFKASAYILATTGSSIVYKAVLGDGTALAVRRIGESGVVKLKEFESQVKAIAKLKHPNLVKLRGFYWAEEEKLVIYDFVSNGSLAASSYKKAGSSPCHLSFEVRLKIARGVARGLSYIHEKKHVHGNIKPTNILLSSPDMEPLISDLGLDRLVSNNSSSSHKPSTSSTRLFESQRNTFSTTAIARDIPLDLYHLTPSSPYAPGSSTSLSLSPYQAPEAMKTLKPNPKWDVYSFGVVLLELLTGRALSEPELKQYTAATCSSSIEEKYRLLRMADVAIRADVESREEALVTCFKLGFSCAAFAPQKRPSMKESLTILEKIPS